MTNLTGNSALKDEGKKFGFEIGLGLLCKPFIVAYIQNSEK
jgi:hypothetical protein